MRDIRPVAVIEDGVLRREMCRIWTEPGVDVLRPDRDGVAVVPGGSEAVASP